MLLAKIYVNEGQYDEARLTKISEAVQAALRGTLRCRRTTSSSLSSRCRPTATCTRRRSSACNTLMTW